MLRSLALQGSYPEPPCIMVVPVKQRHTLKNIAGAQLDFSQSLNTKEFKGGAQAPQARQTDRQLSWERASQLIVIEVP